jgi:hypothetical protein
MTRMNEYTWSEEWRRITEAKFWVAQYKLHRKEHGAKAAAKWWEDIKRQIAAKRGQKAVETLIDDMNAQSSKNRSKPR